MLNELDTEKTLLSSIQSSPLLSCLTPEEMSSIARRSTHTHVGKGEYVWLEGGHGEHFGLVTSGFIKMVKGSSHGQEVTMELMGPGQIFGLNGAIEGAGCPLAAVAVTAAKYVRIPTSVFLPIYEANNAFKDRLIRTTALRMHSKINMIARMSSGRVGERIVAVLLLLGESFGYRDGKEMHIDVPLTRQDVAEMAGTTVESCIRVMSSWQKQGLIRTERQHITILDFAKFESLLSY